MSETISLLDITLNVLIAVVVLQVYTLYLKVKKLTYAENVEFDQQKQKMLLSLATVGAVFNANAFYTVFSDCINNVVLRPTSDLVNPFKVDNIVLIDPKAGIYAQPIEDGQKVIIKQSFFVDFSKWLESRYPSAPSPELRQLQSLYGKSPLTSFYMASDDFYAFRSCREKAKSCDQKVS